MIYVLGFGFLMMVILVVVAINKIDDLRLENKILQQENTWLKERKLWK